MSYQYVQYQYPIAQLFHKELLWVDKDCNVYFAFKLLESDDWTYYAGNSSHALTAAGLLTSYGSSEQDAIDNYLTTTRDATSGKVVAMLPANFLAKYARVYVEEGIYVKVYEWTPSVYVTANEIVTGELLITDLLSDTPTIRIVANSVDRVKLGKVGDHYGLFGYDESGNLVFEMSENGQTIGGWTFTQDTLTCGSGDNGLLLDAANSKIESTNYVSGAMGKGFHLSPELMEVNNASIRGVLQCTVFKKDTINAVGGDLLIVDSDVLDADMTALDSSTLTIKGESAFAVNDILRIKADAFNDEWLRVTDISAAPTYTVTRDLVGSYAADNNPAWPKGSAVVNYRQSGKGLIYLTAADITGSPSISVITYGATPWSDTDTQLKIGNLEGFLGMGNVYGFAVGDEDQYIKYDPAGGLRIKGDIIIDGGDTEVDWGDVTNKPEMFDTPSGSGLFLSSTHMGFFSDSTWKTYIDNVGNLVLGNVATGAGLSWNQTTGELAIQGSISIISALNADGPVTLNEVNGGLYVTGGGITLSSGGSFKGGQTAYNTGTGFFLGYESSAYKLSIGNPSGNYLTWDGVSLSVAGQLTMISGSVLSVLLPGGGQYSYNTSPGTITGAICITLPQSWTNTMMSFDVQVFEYLADKSFMMHLSGYNYGPTSAQWARTTYSILGGSAGNNPQVRFGHNGTRCCIVIGTTSTVWHFPKVTVRNFQASYNNYSEAQWATGWAISVISSETGYTFTATHAAPINDADATITAINGGLSITGGGITLSSGGSFKGGKSSFADNTAGFFLGYDTDDYKFSIGNANNYLTWDGNDLNITGKLIGSDISGSYLKGSSFITKGSYLTSSCSINAETVYIADSTDFASSGTAVVYDSISNTDSFTYTGKTIISLTGCSGVLAHTVSSSNQPIIVPSGQQKVMALSAAANELYFWGDRGDGTISQLTSIGRVSAGGDAYAIVAGNSAPGTNIYGIQASSYSGQGVVAYSVNSYGVFSNSNYQHAIGGFTTSESHAGVYGVSLGMGAGYGGKFEGTSGSVHLYRSGVSGVPTHSAAQGTLVVSLNGVLYVNQNGATNWRPCNTI